MYWKFGQLRNAGGHEYQIIRPLTACLENIKDDAARSKFNNCDEVSIVVKARQYGTMYDKKNIFCS